jgi:hypothetical protein
MSVEQWNLLEETGYGGNSAGSTIMEPRTDSGNKIIGLTEASMWSSISHTNARSSI